MPITLQYSILITYPGGIRSYLEHRHKTAWTRRARANWD